MSIGARHRNSIDVAILHHRSEVSPAMIHCGGEKASRLICRGYRADGTEIVRSWVYDCGYRGWFTMEIFNRTMACPSPEVPRHYAKRGQASWKSLVEVLKLNEVK
ncbi:hypothetical protein V1520DRAFT_349001 [Lipomyces starkeyi]